MKRMVIFTIAAALVFPSAAGASERLTMPQAHHAIIAWSAAIGATWQKIESCRRRLPRRVDCVIRESGWTTDELDGAVAEDVWSRVRATKSARIQVRWLDFIWAPTPEPPET